MTLCPFHGQWCWSNPDDCKDICYKQLVNPFKGKKEEKENDMENIETLDVVPVEAAIVADANTNGDIALEVLAQDQEDIGAEGLEEGTTTVLN